MDRNFQIGEIVRIDTKAAFYQIVAKRNEEQFYIRKIFDKSLELKLGKAELYHKSYVRNLSNDYRNKIDNILKNDSKIKEKLNDLTLDPAFIYYSWVITLYKIKDSEFETAQKVLSEEIEKKPTDKNLNKILKKLQRKKLIVPTNLRDNVKLQDDENIYRVECGRYESDFDNSGKMSFRCARFYKINIKGLN